MSRSTEQSAASAKKSSRAVWGASPAGTTHAPAYAPGTREFFDAARTARRETELRFLRDIPPFATFKGRDVLEVGSGAGFDAFEFCEAGARYTGIDITPENPPRCRTHLGFYGHAPRLLQADAEHLPFTDAAFDVYFSNGVLHHTPDIQKSVNEAARVLRPGGEAWIILYHKNSVFYRVTLWLVQHVLLFGFLKMSFRDRLGRIEHTTSDDIPLVRVFSRKDTSQLIQKSGMRVDSIWVRKLTPEDLPNLPILRSLWRTLPASWLDALGRRVGWYVIVRAIKAGAA